MKYLNIVFIFLSTLLLSQKTSFPKDFRMKSNSFSTKLYEQSNINVYYKLISIDKQDSQLKSFESICVLEIGDNFSKFCDRSTLKLDSLLTIYSNKEYVNAEQINNLIKNKILWSGVILKDQKGSKIIQQNSIAGTLYQYEESVPMLEWKLEDATKNILGYNCRKSTVKYRGRQYTAWYSTDIPINNGPYIFYGLPGLILEIEDKDQFVHFIAEGIEKKIGNIYLAENKAVINTTREKYRKVKENYFDNPGAFHHGVAFNEDGTPIIPKPSKSRFYNPLELE